MEEEDPTAVPLSSEDIPDGVNDRMWSILQRIDTNTSAASRRIGTLETSVKALGDEVSTLKDTVVLLANRLERAERKNTKLGKELSEVKAHSMSENLILSCDGPDYREVQGENCVALVRQFLINVMGVTGAATYFIPVAHRLGTRRPDRSRQIVVRLPVASELQTIMKHTNRLKGTRHFVSRQLPAEHRERQQFALDRYKAARTNPANKASMVREKLFIKGQLQSQFLPDKLPLPNSEAAEIEVTEGPSVDDQCGSKFAGFSARVGSLEDVRTVRDQLLMRPSVAGTSDLMFAYRISGPNGAVRENFDSEFDYGVGLQLLRSMREDDLMNVVCFATRTCSKGYRHIGDRRFKIINSICGEAVKLLT